MTAVMRLFTLFAMLLLPFGMAAAPAEAHHAGVTMPSEHCPEEPQDTSSGTVGHHCAMPCSSALPADLPAILSDSLVRSAAQSPVPPVLAGLELEIATPPPKLP